MEDTQTQTEQTEVANTAEATAPAGEATQTETVTENPEWFKADKYKTIADQAKAYNGLESKLGGFTGAPADGYSLAEGIDADPENPLFKGLTEIGSKYNMNNDMYNEIITMYNTQASVDAKAYREAQLKELGEDAQTRIKNINDWVGANVPEEFRDNFLNWSQSAKDVSALEALIGMTKGQKMGNAEVTNTTPEFSREGYEALAAATDDRGRKLMSTDPSYLAKVRDYGRKLSELQNG